MLSSVIFFIIRICGLCNSWLHVLNVGTDAILLGAETLRGLYPVDTISTVGKICAEVCIHFPLNVRTVSSTLMYQVEVTMNVFFLLLQAEKVYNQAVYFKKTVKYIGEPMSHLESIASSAVSSR
jgi:pyruvate kinase